MASILLVHFDGAKRKSVSEHALVVKSLLQFHNPDWTEAGFNFDPLTKHLSLSGKGLKFMWKKRLGNEMSFTQSLPVQSLSLRDTDIDSLWRLGGMNINKLDVHLNPSINLKLSKGILPDLKIIVVSKAQSKNLVHVHRKDLKIVVTK